MIQNVKKLLKLILKPADFNRVFSKPFTKERTKLILTAGLARVFGKKTTCCICGKKVTKVIAFVHEGRLVVWGLQELPVKVEFHDRQTLRFRHVIPEMCKPKPTETPEQF